MRQCLSLVWLHWPINTTIPEEKCNKSVRQVGGGRWVRNLGSGCLAVHVCQANAGSLPTIVGSLYRNGWAWHILGVGGVSDPFLTV